MKSLEGTQVRYISDQIALAQHTSFLEYFRPLLHFFFYIVGHLVYRHVGHHVHLGL